MRVLLAVVCLISGIGSARADEAAGSSASESKADLIVWNDAFASVSGVQTGEPLRIFVITNDDPLVTDRSAPSTSGDLWCRSVIENAIRGVFSSRPGLRGQIVLQRLPVGMPKRLAGGENRNRPARAIVAVCDAKDHLLGFSVGVPNADQLLTLIEDSEEVRSLWKLHRPDRGELIELIAERSEERLSRTWRELLGEMLVAMEDGQSSDESLSPREAAGQQRRRLTFLAETYEPLYLADARLRYGFSDSSDRTRLIVLEQHPETRAAWVDATIPFLAREDFAALWRPLCERLWGVQPIRSDVADPELLKWWDAQIARGPVVLSLKPVAHRSVGKAAVFVKTDGRFESQWLEVQRQVLESPFRIVDAQQLFMVMHVRDLSPIDIQSPARPVYLLFDTGGELISVLREGESPAAFSVRLKRASQ